MAKVVLVYPPIVFGQKSSFGYPPLGILYMATVLQKKGIDVRVIDSIMEGHTLEELTEMILREKPRVVGFSAMSCQVNTILDVAAELKNRCPSLKIIVGGSHIGSTKGELFDFTENIDFLIYGEGEESFYELVNAMNKEQSLEKINGLIYKKNGKVIVNNSSPPIQDLDSLPFPNLDLVDVRRYSSNFAKSLPLTSLMASRGCPYTCTFCTAHFTHGKAVRLRTPKNIVDEMEYNRKKYGIKQFVFKDSNFTVNKKWAREICSEIIRRGFKINWTCNTRVNLIDEETLKLMKRSGCHMIMFGIESGSQKILNSLCKGITVEQIKTAISLCKKAGIQTTGYFMIGNPGETEAEARETIKISQELGLDLATFGVTVAYPGTDFYKWGLENNAISDRFWYMKKSLTPSSDMREVNGNLNLNDFPPEKQLEMVKKATKSFYFRPSFLFNYAFKIRTLHDIKKSVKSFIGLITAR